MGKVQTGIEETMQGTFPYLTLMAVFHVNRTAAKRTASNYVHIISSAWVFTKQWNTLRFATIRLKWKTGLRTYVNKHIKNTLHLH